MTQPTIEGVGHGVPRMLYASDGSNWYAILIDALGHLQVDVVSAALGSGGATAANQTTMITALQLIDDLRNALGSVATDDLQVDVKTYPGVNTLLNIPFGYYDVYGEYKSTVTTNGNVTIDGSAVPAGEVWIVTNVTGWHNDPAARICLLRAIIGGTVIDIAGNRALAQYTWLDRQGMWVLKAGDYMRVVAESLATGMTGFAGFSGYKMKVA